MTPRIAVIHSVAVYDGRVYLGDIAELANGQFAAFDPRGERIGVTDDKDDAKRLILPARVARVAT